MRVEKMLAAQMGLFHSIATRTGRHAIETTDRLQGIIDSKVRDNYTVQHQRLVNSATRASEGFQPAALTLQKLRTGGKQSISVTHVHQQTQVNEGGQAVVTAGVGAERPRGAS